MAAKGTKVGSGYVTIYSEFDKGFGNDLERQTKNALGRTQKPVSKFSQNVNAKAIAMGNIMSNVAMKGFGAITSHAGKAITRLDTIKSYPRTMKSLGYSTEEAAKSIAAMNKHLIGLPTATADLTGFVKGLASSGMELGRATDIGLAFNDMLLAGGASSAEAASAMEQYNQMVAVGKVDLQSWKIIQEKCAGQLGIVAKKLLGTNANATDLYNAMKDGTVTFDDFNDAMLDCAKNGGEGFDSFADAAKANCGGIQTAIDNVSNRLDQAFADALDAIGQENITEFLDRFSSKFQPIAEKCIPVIADLALKMLDLADKCLPLMDYIPEITAALIGFKIALDGIKAYTFISDALSGLPKLSMAAGDAFAAIQLGAEAAFTVLKTAAGNAWAAIQLGAEAAYGAIMAHPIAAAIAAITAALVYFFTQTEIGRALWATFCDFISAKWAQFKVLFTAACSAISATWGQIVATIQGAWTAACSAVTGVWTGVKDTVNGVTSAIGNFFTSTIPGAVRGAFESARSSAASKMNAMKSTVSSVISKIKGLFNFTISLPKPRIPKLKVDGGEIPWGIGGKGRMPNVSFAGWYAKGGVFDAPSLIGVGEAGPEAAMPLKAIKPYFKEAAQETNMGNSYSIGQVIVQAKDFEEMRTVEDFFDNINRQLVMA